MAVQLDQQLLEILACPCPEHGHLRVDQRPAELDAEATDTAEGFLTCTACGRHFPIRDGIPVLLLDEAVGGPSAAEPPESADG